MVTKGNDSAKSYSELSRGTKMSMDLDRRAALKKAKKAADDGDSMGTRFGDGAAKVLASSPFNVRGSDDIAQINANAGERERKRQRALSEAQEEADYGDITPPLAPGQLMQRQKYFTDVKPKPSAGYAKGGMVKSTRGWGKARKC
jgi:hypothetical protein